MKLQKMLFRLDDAMDLRKCKGASWSWRLCGETIEGKQLTLRTAKIGRGEKRWDPTKLIGETLRVTFDATARGNLVADLWRPSWAEGDDLAALFAHDRTLYQVEQERLTLQATVSAHTEQVAVRVGICRL